MELGLRDECLSLLSYRASLHVLLAPDIQVVSPQDIGEEAEHEALSVDI